MPEESPLPCFVPVHARIAMAMAKAVGAPTSRLTDAEFKSDAGAFGTLTLTYLITPESAAKAIELIGAIDPEAAR